MWADRLTIDHRRGLYLEQVWLHNGKRFLNNGESRIRYIAVEYENRSATTAIIDEQAGKGFRYAGHVPVKIGPSGKVLAVDLIFED